MSTRTNFKSLQSPIHAIFTSSEPFLLSVCPFPLPDILDPSFDLITKRLSAPLQVLSPPPTTEQQVRFGLVSLSALTAHQVLFERGDRGSEMYLVVDGAVSLSLAARCSLPTSMSFPPSHVDYIEHGLPFCSSPTIYVLH